MKLAVSPRKKNFVLWHEILHGSIYNTILHVFIDGVVKKATFNIWDLVKVGYSVNNKSLEEKFSRMNKTWKKIQNDDAKFYPFV